MWSTVAREVPVINSNASFWFCDSVNSSFVLWSQWYLWSQFGELKLLLSLCLNLPSELHLNYTGTACLPHCHTLLQQAQKKQKQSLRPRCREIYSLVNSNCLKSSDKTLYSCTHCPHHPILWPTPQPGRKTQSKRKKIFRATENRLQVHHFQNLIKDITSCRSR